MQLSDYIAAAGLLIAIWAILEARRANKLAQSTADQERRNLLRVALIPASEHSGKLLELARQNFILNKGMDGPLDEARQVIATQQHVYLNGAATERLGSLGAALQRTIHAFHAARYQQDIFGQAPSVPYEPESGSIAERNKDRAAELLLRKAQTRETYETELGQLVPALEQELAALLQEDRKTVSTWRRKKRGADST